MAQVKKKKTIFLQDDKCKGKKAEKKTATPHKYEYYQLFGLNC
jgi:hypothetical protein